MSSRGLVHRTLLQSLTFRFGMAVGVFLMLLGTLSSPALAHSELISTNPADGVATDLADGRIELTFSEAVTPTGAGSRLLDSRGALVPASVYQPTRSTLVIEPDAPLTDGIHAVIWNVRSDDGHVLSGSLSFTIVSAGSEDEEGSAAPNQTATAEEGDSPPAGDSTPTTVVLTPIAPAVGSEADGPLAGTSDAESPMDDIARQQGGAAAEVVADIGRWLTMVGGLLAIGAFVFASTSLLGTVDEVRRAVVWMRRGGVLVLVGTILEVLAASWVIAESPAAAMSIANLFDVLDGQFGVAVLLRIAGGVAMLQDPSLVGVSSVVPPPDAHAMEEKVGPGHPPGTSTTTALRPSAHRLEGEHEWTAMVGMAAFAASFLFSGHTVTAEPLMVARVATVVHIVAAGVWFGGIALMATTLTRRWRRAVPLDASPMALRFSRIASVSLVLVAVAGIALAWTILDSPSQLVSTPWGRVLLVKVVLVGLTASIGAYNHFVVVPHLEGDEHRSDLLRRTVRAECVILLGILAVTAVLVSAAI